jgi:hypothetical protein
MAGIKAVLLPLAAMLCCLSCNSILDTALNDKIAQSETWPPTPGGDGALTVGAPRATVIPLTWTKATDNVTVAADIEYQVVYSVKDDIGSVADAEANGTVAMDWTKDADACDVTGLTVLTSYYVNVLTKDRAQNVAAYVSASAKTTQDTTDPSAGSPSTLALDNSMMDVLFVSWTKGSDDVSPQNKLKYQIYTSKSDNVATLSEVIANGTPYGTTEEDIAFKEVKGLDDDIDYYVNVVVQDEVGLTAAYTSAKKKTAKHGRLFISNCPNSFNISCADSFGPYTRTTIFSGSAGDGPMAIAVDPVDRKIYWTDYNTSQRIRRANFDGSNIQDVITSGLAAPDGIAIDYDSSRRFLYWTDSTKNKIYRSTLPPPTTSADTYAILTNATDGVSGPEGIDVDIATGNFYWAESGSKRIRKAPAVSPSGNISDLVITGLTHPFDIAFSNGVYYWTDISANKIQAHAVSGSTYDVISSNLNSPEGISVANGQIFWVDFNGKAYCAPVGTTDPNASNHSILSGLGYPTGIQIY